MDWIEYKSKFTYLAKYHNYDDNYIGKCLNYAKTLFDQNLPIIYDLDHLANLVGYNKLYIMKVCNAQNLFYREFKIPKKREGEFRKISEPLPNLKQIQRWILDNILYKVDPSPHAKAYRLGYSIKDNAKFHRKQKTVLTMDIENYFGTIDYRMVFTLFKNLGYSKFISTILSNLCIMDNCLPQGAPTSAMLSNLVTKKIDDDIVYYAKKHKIRYTRYADDLTFSGDIKEDKLIKFVNKILKSYGFIVNENKTRTRYQSQQQEVTGIVVNEKLQAARVYRREFRKNMYYVKAFGLENHLSFLEKNNKKEVYKPINYIYHLLGKANFIKHVNPNEEQINEDIEFLKTLLKSYKSNRA